jgi:hypothetical protein
MTNTIQRAFETASGDAFQRSGQGQEERSQDSTGILDKIKMYLPCSYAFASILYVIKKIY